MMKRFLCLVCVAFFLSVGLLVGCGGDTNNNNNNNGGDCGDTNVSFSKCIQPLLTSTCATSGCHSGSTPMAGLGLEDGKAYAAIVGKDSKPNAGKKLVEASKPENSTMYLKVLDSAGRKDKVGGSRMPLGKDPWSDANIKLLETWIKEGAKNN